MSFERRSIYEWATIYCGDPASHVTRGVEIRSFLVEEGLRPHHRVLDIGCGALSQGGTLMTYLDPGNYVGLEPNGWLVEAALNEFPFYLDRNPMFSYRTDFDASEYGPFDYVISHSVMSHMAHWQMEQALLKVRDACNDGAVWLSSLRVDQYDLFAQEWVYPGVSYFRLQTVQTLGFHAGWSVEIVPEYQKRLKKIAPNDYHDWIRLKAILPTDRANAMRLEMEGMIERRRIEINADQEAYAVSEGAKLEELCNT